MSKLHSKSADSIAKLFTGGKLLGKGANGEARLVEYGGKAYVFKKTFDADPNGSFLNANFAKQEEEKAHIEIYRRLSPSCRSYVCRPIPSLHNRISIQLAATQRDDEHIVTLKNFIQKFRFIRPGQPARRSNVLSDKLKNLHGDVTPLALVRDQLAQAVACLHMVGAVHGDLKGDNAVVVYKKSDKNKKAFDVLKVKLIDFGLAEFATVAVPLVRANLNSTGNPRIRSATKLKQLDAYVYRNESNANDTYQNHVVVLPKALISPPRLAAGKPRSIRGKFVSPLDRAGGSPLAHQYARHVYRTQNAAAKRIQGAMKRHQYARHVYRTQNAAAKRIQGAMKRKYAKPLPSLSPSLFRLASALLTRPAKGSNGLSSLSPSLFSELLTSPVRGVSSVPHSK
jgi:serine/threonine protein kinase